MKIIFSTMLLLGAFNLSAQNGYWQQDVDYKMDINLDVNTNIFTGKEKVVYTNKSPNTLNKMYLHLYWNAFQPNSLMDERSRSIVDPDRRVGDRISHLKPEEEGKTTVNSVVYNGKKLDFKVIGTLLEISGMEIPSGQTAEFTLDFETQVPIQIRRAGRDNAQGIRFTMTQWYPKVAAYDEHGWHIDQYIGREFYGEWSDFDVCITLDKEYSVAGTGNLQNVSLLSESFGYDESDGKLDATRYTTSKDKNTWHFYAENVHDFAWASDPNYEHKKVTLPTGQQLHFFYQEDDNANKGWEKLVEEMPEVFEIANNKFGKYPYKQYSFIQGGDGGMEYPMCTMVKGSSRGTAIHELMHSWYQGMLATNELWYEWMDEGFTTWSSGEIEHIINEKEGEVNHTGSKKHYQGLVNYKREEPICNHADMYKTNFGYSASAYSKGTLFLENLQYIVGRDNLYAILKEYHKQWAFKHPDADRFIRIAEEVSGMHLDHFFIDWTKTIKHIDYGFGAMEIDGDKIALTVLKKGEMAMPLEIVVEKNNGEKVLYYLPLMQMYGRKTQFQEGVTVKNLEAIPWTRPGFNLILNEKASDIKSVNIFGSDNIPDVLETDNEIDFTKFEFPSEKTNYNISVETKTKKVKRKNKAGKMKKVKVEYKELNISKAK
ncbi:MAG: M1 family metallopeptidase [Flavobacteriales bacterium]